MMRHQNDPLEICLERLAQGDTIENCLADYPQHADVLRPLLESAQQVHSLPPQQLNAAADKQIEKRLRMAVRRQKTPAAAQPSILEVMMKSVMRLIPRVTLGAAALALILFLLAQLPFWRSPEMEPMVSETAIAVPGSQSELDLSADPGQVPLYRVQVEAVPDTPEAMLDWARAFGLPDPALYERPSGDDSSLYVIGSDGRRLNFSNNLSSGDIFYTNPQAATSGDLLPFAEASQIAIAFLRQHNLLPDTYQVDAPLFAPQTNSWQSIIVRAALANGVIGELNDYGAGQTIIVAADGQIAHATLRRLTIEMIEESAEIISAQAAYEKLLAGEVAASGGGGGGGPMGTSYEPPASWQVGEEVALVGYLEVFVGVEDGRIQATLSGPSSTLYQLTGSRIAELAEDTWREAYLIEGVITEQVSSSIWQLEVRDWQQVAYDDGGCLIGELKWQDDVAYFQSDEGNEYGLPQAPAEIADGERLQVCFSFSDEPGKDLIWSIIHVPPLVEQMSFSSGGSMVAQEVSVEHAVAVSVTRIVTPMADAESGLTIVPQPPLAPAEDIFTEPENPYSIGDQVEMIGLVQGIRLVDDAGSSHLELQLLNDDESDTVAYSLAYRLVAPTELIEEMAVFADLHIRVQGEIVAAPESKLYSPSHGQAIAVASFDRPWPDEKLENFLGHFTTEEIEGRYYMVFTDHLTNQRYVVDPQFPLPDERDVRFNEGQGLLTAVINPAAEPIGGLPVMLNRGYATGSEITLATDVSQLPLPTERVGTINEADLRGGIMGDNDIVERVELVYPYNPYGNGIEAQVLQPVWVFYGRNAAGTQFFTATIQAVK